MISDTDTTNIIPFKIEHQDDGELRISDSEISSHLGYGDVKAFRRLLRDHLGNLNKINQVLSAHLVNKQGGGRQGKAFWLTESQALYMISRSDKPIASDLMVDVSIAFVDMRRQFHRRPITKDILRINILSPEVQVWKRRFEKQFFVNLHRVLGLPLPDKGSNSQCGHFINRYVYGFLFGELGLEVIREANPKVPRDLDDGSSEYNRAYRHHQMLKDEHMPAFKKHVSTINTLLGIAQTSGHFEDMFNATFPTPQTQIGFLFNESKRH